MGSLLLLPNIILHWQNHTGKNASFLHFSQGEAWRFGTFKARHFPREVGWVLCNLALISGHVFSTAVVACERHVLFHLIFLLQTLLVCGSCFWRAAARMNHVATESKRIWHATQTGTQSQVQAFPQKVYQSVIKHCWLRNLPLKMEAVMG